MTNHDMGNELASILARLTSVENQLGALRIRKEGVSAVDTRSAVQDLHTLALRSLPNRTDVEPFETSGNSGKWRCDPKSINVLRLNGNNLPFTEVVFYKLIEMSWQATPTTEAYTRPCPSADNGGLFPQLQLHSLVFGLGSRGVGCKNSFAIEGSQPNPVWIAVNDTDYGDNQGHMIVRVSW
jgi:hypothetical protein